MPELPEVDAAARVLRGVALGKTIFSVDVRHPAQARSLGPNREALIGEHVTAVERRGKHQLLRLASGRTLHVHFRMTGDWAVGAAGDPLPAYARVVFAFTDGSRIALVDPRALSIVTLHDSDPLPALGPDANDPSFTPTALGDALATRRIAIKPALLDQRVVAGLGNIYAAESLWVARLDPRRRASSLTRPELARLVRAIKTVLARAFRDAGRYANGDSAQRFQVYDREGLPCRRCGATIRRIVQAGRSTYFCPGHQIGRVSQVGRVSPKPRRSRPSGKRSRGS